MKRGALWFLPWVLSGGLAGCLDSYEPDVGELTAGVCKNDDKHPDEEISFEADIAPILEMNCSCHDPRKGGSAIDLVGFSVENYAKVRRGGANSGDKIVVPKMPCDSIIVQKVSESPPFGVRMPTFGPYLSREERDLLHDWIAEGARDN
ncbi:MAG: hypothetical protein QM778_25125 [Myxococcales bacterium]